MTPSSIEPKPSILQSEILTTRPCCDDFKRSSEAWYWLCWVFFYSEGPYSLLDKKVKNYYKVLPLFTREDSLMVLHYVIFLSFHMWRTFKGFSQVNSLRTFKCFSQVKKRKNNEMKNHLRFFMGEEMKNRLRIFTRKWRTF